MEEQKNTENGTATVQQDELANQSEERDTNTLLTAEINNSKKLRKRAQEAESKLEAINARLAKQEEEKMIQDGKLEELVASLKAENKTLKSKHDEAQGIISAERAKLLEQVPEEEREAFESLPFNTLKVMVNKLAQQIPASTLPNTNPAVKKVVSDKPLDQMTDSERRAWHADKLNNR